MVKSTNWARRVFLVDLLVPFCLRARNGLKMDLAMTKAQAKMARKYEVKMEIDLMFSIETTYFGSRVVVVDSVATFRLSYFFFSRNAVIVTSFLTAYLKEIYLKNTRPTRHTSPAQRILTHTTHTGNMRLMCSVVSNSKEALVHMMNSPSSKQPDLFTYVIYVKT